MYIASHNKSSQVEVYWVFAVAWVRCLLWDRMSPLLAPYLVHFLKGSTCSQTHTGFTLVKLCEWFMYVWDIMGTLGWWKHKLFSFVDLSCRDASVLSDVTKLDRNLLSVLNIFNIFLKVSHKSIGLWKCWMSTLSMTWYDGAKTVSPCWVTQEGRKYCWLYLNLIYFLLKSVLDKEACPGISEISEGISFLSVS